MVAHVDPYNGLDPIEVDSDAYCRSSRGCGLSIEGIVGCSIMEEEMFSSAIEDGTMLKEHPMLGELLASTF